ncbi:MAG: rhomboid family intramembrane serine protease [candidate division Zixibacteria bacterium]|nr:rhomboid family intramembrane serine protease [candidate division Zixibacteria bacterium]
MSFNQHKWNSMGRGFRIGPGGLSAFIKWMLIINSGVFILQMIFPRLTYLLGLTPATFYSDFPNQIYQIFTYMFLHGGFGHIFFNMFALWMFGTEIEYTWGSRSFGRFYLICGLAGAVLTLIVLPSQTIPMIGASAAIYGILVAYWIMFPNRYLYIYFLFPIKVKWAIPGMMLLGFLFSAGNVAHMAHLGGALCGLAYVKSDWRFKRIFNKFKNLRYKHQEAKLNKRRQEAEDIMKRVDAILDKINEVGIENISKSDRKFLEEASSQLSHEKNKENN